MSATKKTPAITVRPTALHNPCNSYMTFLQAPYISPYTLLKVFRPPHPYSMYNSVRSGEGEAAEIFQKMQEEAFAAGGRIAGYIRKTGTCRDTRGHSRDM